MSSSIANGTCEPLETGAAKRDAGHCAACTARNVSICQAMPDDCMGVLDSMASKHSIKKGETFITEADEANAVFNITAGSAKIYKLLGDGRRQIIGFLGTGDFLGLAPGRRYPFSAEAITPMKYCQFKRTRMETVFAEYPTMRRKILEIASNELAEAQEQMLLLGRKTAEEKIASFLLGRLQRAKALGGGGNSIDIPMSRHDIGDFLGLTTETVSRQFSKMKSNGLISLKGTSTVMLHDHDGLQTLASGY
ncbi:MAG: helix-turn-helix domain-containing protein [Pseudomonadota bacterium]